MILPQGVYDGGRTTRGETCSRKVLVENIDCRAAVRMLTGLPVVAGQSEITVQACRDLKMIQGRGQIKGGIYTLPTAPGRGVSFDPDFIKHHTVN